MPGERTPGKPTTRRYTDIEKLKRCGWLVSFVGSLGPITARSSGTELKRAVQHHVRAEESQMMPPRRTEARIDALMDLRAASGLACAVQLALSCR